MATIISTDERIKLLAALGAHMSSGAEEWLAAKQHAQSANPWFTAAHIDIAANNIAQAFLQEELLREWVAGYTLPEKSVKVGIVMAGNIPMVGFHDLLCGFMSGHHICLKLSSKDEVLMKYVINYLVKQDARVADYISVAEQIAGCDAYIATGSNNSARYFEQYFGKYPNIIRKNRTSVAILDGAESDEDLSALADDVYLYYGLGCRNVTQVCVPEGYDFERLLNAFRKYNDYKDMHKYKNNYDYHLAIYLLNKVPYMSNESLLMVENELPFAAVSVLHYRYYTDKRALKAALEKDENIQSIIGYDCTPFGTGQQPALSDYADGVDTMKFLCGL